jgi:hypothetical protein
MQDIGDEINNSIWCELGYWLVLDLLGKLVDSHQYMGETAWRRCDGPNHIKAPTGKRPGWQYGDETARRDMRLLAKELAVLASPQEVPASDTAVGHQKLALHAFPTNVLEAAWLPQTPSCISRNMSQPSSFVTHFVSIPDRAPRR